MAGDFLDHIATLTPKRTTANDFINVIRDIRGNAEDILAASQDPSCIYGDIVIKYLDFVDKYNGTIPQLADVYANLASIVTAGDNIAAIETIGNNLATLLTVTSNMADIQTVATDINDVVTVAGNMAVVNNLNSNLATIETVNTQIVPNLAEILLADDNAAIATAKAQEASDSAIVAEAKASETAADALATAADRVQTGLDSVQTGADAISTANDVVTVSDDADQVAIDRLAVMTALGEASDDAAHTAADRVQTGLDVVTARTAKESAERSASNALASEVIATKVIEMTALTGTPGSEAEWDNVTGELTVPRGATGAQGIPGLAPEYTFTGEGTELVVTLDGYTPLSEFESQGEW